jgi:hypothetical protein
MRHLEAAAKESPHEPDPWERLALAHHHRDDWQRSLEFAERAIAAPISTHATDPLAKARAAELASIALWHLDRRADALTHAKAAAAQLHWDERVVANAAAMEASL